MYKICLHIIRNRGLDQFSKETKLVQSCCPCICFLFRSTLATSDTFHHFQPNFSKKSTELSSCKLHKNEWTEIKTHLHLSASIKEKWYSDVNNYLSCSACFLLICLHAMAYFKTSYSTLLALFQPAIKWHRRENRGKRKKKANKRWQETRNIGRE